MRFRHIDRIMLKSLREWRQMMLSGFSVRVMSIERDALVAEAAIAYKREQHNVIGPLEDERM